MQWPFSAMSLLNALFAHFHKLSDNTDDPIWVIRKQGHSDFKNIVYCIFLILHKADKRARNKCFVMFANGYVNIKNPDVTNRENICEKTII